MQNINIKLNPDDLLDISSQVPIKTGTTQQVTNVSDVLTGPAGPAGPRGDTGPQGPAGPAGPAGPRGDTGPQGPAGPAGPAGETGAIGPQGPKGETGATGQSANISIGTVTTLYSGSNATVVNSGTSMDAVLDFGIPQGPQGETGATGPAGPQGIQGETGPAGPQGETGPAGPAGPQGIQGETGPAGPQGETGPAGPAGPRGETGPQGIQGETGPAGPQGETGPAGPAGPRGETGPQGIQGETGPAGPAGPQGIQGETGPAGPAGPQGIQGETGPAGPQGETGPAGPAGPRGETGPQGIQGETGPAGPAGPSATITVGTVTTLPAGSNATVTNSGTSSSAVFDFGIPQGASGSVSYLDVKGFIDTYLKQEMPKCYAYTDTRGTSFTGTIPFNQFVVNEGGFTFSRGRIIVPKTGYYKVSARISGQNGWLRLHAYPPSGSATISNIFASAINRMGGITYHSVVIDSSIVYLSSNQIIDAEQVDSSFDLNAGMDAGIKGTTITIEYLGTAN